MIDLKNYSVSIPTAIFKSKSKEMKQINEETGFYTIHFVTELTKHPNNAQLTGLILFVFYCVTHILSVVWLLFFSNILLLSCSSNSS